MANSNYCEHPKGWTLIQCHHGTRLWVPVRCRKCHPCRLAKVGVQIAKITAAIDLLNWPVLVTLTSKPDMTWPLFMRKWTIFVRWMRSTYPNAHYAAVKEEGLDKGMKHLHVVLLGIKWFPQQKLSREWESLTGAWNVDIRRINPGHLPGYLLAYLSKPFAGARKQVTYSTFFPKLPPQQGWRTVGKLDAWHTPTHFIGISEGRGLVDNWGEGCTCIPPPRRLTLFESSWLEFTLGPWRHPSLVP